MTFLFGDAVQFLYVSYGAGSVLAQLEFFSTGIVSCFCVLCVSVYDLFSCCIGFYVNSSVNCVESQKKLFLR